QRPALPEADRAARSRHPLAAPPLPARTGVRGRVPGRPDLERDGAAEREGRARPVRPVSSPDAAGRRAIPGRPRLDRAARARLAARARGREATPAAFLPVRLVRDLNERNGA